jgi:parallel beta-helix repeat protein
VAGIDLTGGGASGNLIKENIVTSSAAGIKFGPGWTGNRIIENSLQMNTCGIQGEASGNTFKENVFTANGSDSCF